MKITIPIRVGQHQLILPDGSVPMKGDPRIAAEVATWTRDEVKAWEKKHKAKVTEMGMEVEYSVDFSEPRPQPDEASITAHLLKEFKGNGPLKAIIRKPRPGLDGPRKLVAALKEVGRHPSAAGWRNRRKFKDA